MEAERMMYVAADPKQPGAAFAACVDDPKYAKDTAKDIAGWVRRGATVLRVTPDVAREMMLKWVRPEKKKKAAKHVGML